MIDPHDFGPAPSADPSVYPGRLPGGSGLLASDGYRPLAAVVGRRLAHWRVDGEPLGHVLLRHNQTPVGQRYPVLAAGSNAAPAQLRYKFGQAGVSPVLPMTLAEVTGLAVGVSAHVSKPGYLPATLVTDPAATARLFVIWPDRAQLAALDDTEPNYHRVLLTDGSAVDLASGERLSHCYAYLGRHGHLVDAAGTALPLDGQDALRAALCGRDEELAKLLAGPNDDDTRERARLLFLARDWVVPCGEAADPVARPEPVEYDARPPAHPVPPGHWRVLATGDGADRDGEAVVRVAPEGARSFASTHVMASTDVGVAALARLDADPAVPAGPVAALDQVVRNAIGADVGEDVRLRPVSVPRRRLADLVAGRPQYLTCRVQAADLTTVERPVCLLDELTLDLLGVAGGDEVVVEGGAAPDGTVARVRLKAFRTSDAVQQRREALHGGDLRCRFPKALDALGVYPDLPWIFLDSAARSRLGLGRQKLATVRLRASRRYQLAKEWREILLLLGLTFIGLIQVLERPGQRVAALLGLVLLVVMLVVLRLRGRLTRVLRGRRQGKADVMGRR